MRYMGPYETSAVVLDELQTWYLNLREDHRTRLFYKVLRTYRLSRGECARFRENVPYIKYTDLTQNTYIRS